MTTIKPSSHGIVVDHKGSEVRYAISDKNYNPEVHRKVRDLRPGETVRGFQPRPKGALGDQEGTGTPEADAGSAADASEALGESPEQPTKTEGSAPAGTKGNK